MERKAEAEQHEDVHDEEAADVVKNDVLEHDGERVHFLETLREIEREQPAEHEDDGHSFDVDVCHRSAEVEHVPDDCSDPERQRRQLSNVVE